MVMGIRADIVALAYWSILSNHGHMKIVSATDAKQRLGSVLDSAQREPVMIRRQNRDVAVIISVEQYELIRRNKIKELHRLINRIGTQAKARGMTQQVLTNILKD
jgi:prevent-host-death family protein